MANRKNDIEKYLRGELTPQEMHALEKEALRDPFLAEALEGLENTGPESFLFDLQEIRKSVHHRTKPKRGKLISISNWTVGIAASLILLAASSVYLISLMQNQKRAELASNEKQKDKSAPIVEDQKILSDSNVSAANKDNRLAMETPKPKNASSGPETKQPDTKRVTKPTDSNIAAGIERTETAEEPTAETDAVGDLAEAPQQLLYKDSVALDDAKKKSSDLAAATRSENSARNVATNINTKIIKGKVTSAEDGSALAGVNVLVKGTNIGTVTDEEGHYEIPLSNSNQNLLFSFIGLQNLETQTGNKDQVDVQLAPDYSQLSEVVVTGSGVSLKEDDHPTPTLQFAEPKGGRQAFQQYLEQEMSYPEQALKNKIEGRVTVQFTVEPNGQLRDFKILKSLGYGCDDEVIRLIKEGPAWSPTRHADQPIKDKVKVRLKFDIPEKK